MSWIRKKALWIPAALVFLAVAGYCAWSYVLGNEVEARIAALRAQGYPTTPEEAAGPPIPADRDAYPLLKQAQDKHNELEAWHVYEEDPAYVEGAPARVVELKPYYAVLDQALARQDCRLPVIEHGLRDFSWVVCAQEALEIRARYGKDVRDDPGRYERQAEGLWKLGGWTSDLLIGVLIRWNLRDSALELLEQGIHRGLLERSELHASWAPRLRAVAKVGELERLYVVERTFVIGILRAAWSGDVEEIMFDESIKTSWLGRPFLYREALRCLDEYQRAIRIAGEGRAALRAWMPTKTTTDRTDETPRWSDSIRHTLKHAIAMFFRHQTRIRLAECALAVHEFVRRQRRLPATAAEVEELLGHTLPQDAYAEGPFTFAVEGNTVVLSSTSEEELRREEGEPLWTWRVPAPRTEGR